jgi:CubicO group peptidase (beta-lactamase class C family)
MSTLRFVWSLLIFSSVWLTGQVLAVDPVVAVEKPAVLPSEEIVVRARSFVEKGLATKVPGLSVAVAVDGKIVWSEAFGYADLEAKRPVTPATRFRIASVSKPVTAAGLMLLVERGQLDLDAPVQKYVPDFPVKPEGVITTRLLGGHLAGVRHYQGTETLLNRPFADVHAGLKIFADTPLIAPPGVKFNYSTYGWSLISAVMESAAQRAFLDYMDEEVFKPIGMTHTRPDRAGVVDADRTLFYVTGPDGKFAAAPPIDSSYKWAGGGFLSTAEDLVKFGSALLQPGLLKETSLTSLFTSQKTSEGKPTGYGIGWFVQRDKHGRPFYFHTGGQQGATSVLFMRPDERLVVAIVCNLSDAPIIGQGTAIADLFAPLATAASENK